MLNISRVSDNEVSVCTSNPCVFQTALFHLLLLFAQHDVIKVISPVVTHLLFVLLVCEGSQVRKRELKELVSDTG